MSPVNFNEGKQERKRCVQATEVYSRVVGFYRPVQHWNGGKKAEFEKRKEYKFPAEA